LYYWEEVPKEKTPEGANDGGNDKRRWRRRWRQRWRPWWWWPFRDASNVLCGLPSLHLGALCISRRVFLGHGGDEVAHGRFGTCGWRRL
jgi:hypothetical protein